MKKITTEQQPRFLDVPELVRYFGGKYQIVADYDQYLGHKISLKAVEKWLERGSISLQNILCLVELARHKRISFDLKDFIS